MIRTKICMLRRGKETVEPCPGGACPFWEEGGVALDAGCGLERLGLRLDRLDLAEYLLELRTLLEEARSVSEREAARRAFAGVIPADLSGR